MAVDPYRICPCGSGNKLKFCCCKDMMSDLDKVLRAMEGDQRASALDRINKLIEDKGPRLALLALKAQLQIILGSLEQASETIAQLFKAAPHNPVALGLSAVVEASEGHVDTAIERLQQALEYVDSMVPHSVYMAIGFVADALFRSGRVIAARGHLRMQAGLAGEQDRSPMSALLRLDAMREIPLLLKEDHFMADCADDAPWSGEFKAAMKSSAQGAWLAACESLSSLSEKVPEQACILRNIAVLRGWLGATRAGLLAWREYAQLEGVPLDDAVEAEALAQLMDADVEHEMIDEVKLTYAVQDTDELMEQLISHDSVVRIPMDLNELATEDQPPPKGAFFLLDRSSPKSGVDLELDAVPLVIGEMYVYGKETDREARLEFVAAREEDLEDRKLTLKGLAADSFGELVKEEVSSQLPAFTVALQRRWHLPEDTPVERRMALMHDQERDLLLCRWPEIAQPVLKGKSAREAAADPKARIAVLAALLIMELEAESGGRGFDFDELRRELGLPPREQIDPTGTAITEYPVVRLSRLNMTHLRDEELLKVYTRAMIKNSRKALYEAALEIIGRPEFGLQVDKNEIYDTLIQAAADTDDALKHVAAAMQGAEQRGESPARWLLAELSIRMSRGEVQECDRLFQLLRARHLQEPGVAQSLRDLLVAYGVITPEGQPAQQPGAPVDANAGQLAADPSQKIWTPDDPGAPAPSSEGKSKFWLPGQD